MKRKMRARKPDGGRIPAAAIDAFRRMEAARDCTCTPIDWGGDYWKRGPECSACEEWTAAHGDLHRALQLPPWQWPAIEYPDAVNPYPEGSVAASHWQRERDQNPERFALYRELKAAVE